MNNDMMGHPGPGGSLDWLLTGLVNSTAGAECAVVLSADGLAMAGSDGIGREDVEHLAAMASALHSLGRGVGNRFGKGALHQTVIELEYGYLLVSEAGDGACLAMLADIDSDLGLLAYEMTVIVGRVREHLSAAPRTSVTTGATHVP
ncbi:roadblock/LC7 domain-containing protein [Nocardia cyriacigeorgica]|jgi:predicted regulator of Ras-like GTPase activity (Roadblock/LC7/MglB family)|uniref:roadblock/LC7 domain-containing protein n=1 Tax=Nocardia cyriacigeorgica TaxID=135487 RepID=UPI0013D526BE|nr:roadblock/LC7 domain-containing protein [Nocardia cyriacigeorgica]NEW26644.1 roadblock/LC7 domain-containing protein [Nocardia cyriacigeorgica]